MHRVLELIYSYGGLFLSEEYKPDLGGDYIKLHKVMTRGINVSLFNINKFLNDGLMEKLNREGFISYVQSFSSVLHGHHMVEDEKIFPYFKDRLPEVPYSRLVSEHEIFDDGLQQINSAIDHLTNETDELESLITLKKGFDKLNEIWDTHIQIENTKLYGEIRDLNMDPEDMVKIEKESKEFFQENSGPGYLVIPFVLYNLSLEDRRVIAKGFPDVVTSKLLFDDWKDKWISMKPFLLE